MLKITPRLIRDGAGTTALIMVDTILVDDTGEEYYEGTHCVGGRSWCTLDQMKEATEEDHKIWRRHNEK